jgi:hypothetical protein
MRPVVNCLVLVALLVWLPPGASPAQTVINVPPTPAPSEIDSDTILNVLPGGVLNSTFKAQGNSVLNVQGGEVGGAGIYAGASGNIYSGLVYEMNAESGGVINSYGGESQRLDGFEGTINVFGGLIDSVDVQGTLNVYGGALPGTFSVSAGSQLTLYANDFRVNGSLVTGVDTPGNTAAVAVPSASTISGVFSDGTPFVLGGTPSSTLPPTVNLVRYASYAPGPSTITVPTSTAPQGIHTGQTLFLETGGTLPTNFTAGYGSHLVVHDGAMNAGFKATGATVDLTGGSSNDMIAQDGTQLNIGGTAKWGNLDLYSGSLANINGGTGGPTFVHPGSTLNITNGQINGVISGTAAKVNVSGGTIGAYQQESMFGDSNVSVSGGSIDGLELGGNSLFNMTGGTISHLEISGNMQAQIAGGKVPRIQVDLGATLDIHSGVNGDISNIDGTTRIFGGALGDNQGWVGGMVELHGYDFQVNGVPVSGLTNPGDSRAFGFNTAVTFTGTLSDGTPFVMGPDDHSNTLTINSNVLHLVQSAAPVLSPTIHVPNDPAPLGAAPGQTVVLAAGGALDDNFVAAHDSNVQINGGTVGNNFEADRSQVTIAGGVVGDKLDVFGGATITMTVGSIGQQFSVHPSGTLNINGGQTGASGNVTGGIVNMTAGTLGSGFHALQGSYVNISGGAVSSEFHADTGSVVNISGGTVDSQFSAASGSTVNVSGGHLKSLTPDSGAVVSISGGNLDLADLSATQSAVVSGGTFGDSFATNSATTLSGTGFELDGAPLAGLDMPGNTLMFTLPANKLLTGTLADGTPFAFTSSEGDHLSSVKLLRSNDLAAAPPTINVPTSAAPPGVRSGQTLTLQSGGSLPDNFNAGRGSRVDVLGGTVGANFEAVGSIVNISAGQVGANFDAFAGSQINISGGSVGTNFDAYSQSVVNVTGGAINRIDALSGSAIHIGGGTLTSLQASPGSSTDWSGGTIDSLSASVASTPIAIHGTHFQLNGVDVSGLSTEGQSIQFDLTSTSILTAILSDGTPIVLSSGINSPLANALLANGNLTLVQSAPSASLSPTFRRLTDNTGPHAIGAGQTLVVDGAGQLPSNFVAGPGSTLDLKSGTADSGLKSFSAAIQIEGGTISGNFNALTGTNLLITAGTLSNGYSLYAGAHLDVYGGHVASPFVVNAGAFIDIYGTSFRLNSQPISGLVNNGDSIMLSDRSGKTLIAVLSDGTTLAWSLAALNPFGTSGISSQATLRLHVFLVPEPTTLLWPMLAALTLFRFRRPGSSEMAGDTATHAFCYVGTLHDLRTLVANKATGKISTMAVR